MKDNRQTDPLQLLPDPMEWRRIARNRRLVFILGENQRDRSQSTAAHACADRQILRIVCLILRRLRLSLPLNPGIGIIGFRTMLR